MKNILLFLVAVLLVVALTPLALLVKLLRVVITMSFDWSWFMRLALSFDQLGNVLGDDLFNWVLIKKESSSRFGDEDETISSVLGKNFLSGTLTILGERLRRLLYQFDKNHSVDAIEK